MAARLPTALLLSAIATSCSGQPDHSAASEPAGRGQEVATPGVVSPPHSPEPTSAADSAFSAFSAPPEGLSGPPEENCQVSIEARPAVEASSRRVRRYQAANFVTDGVWHHFSVRRRGARIRVRWWLEERDCPLVTELFRMNGVVILRESPQPHLRCAAVGATIVETVIRLREEDRRLCVPGQSTPIDLSDLERWAAPLTRPPRRTTADRIDPWSPASFETSAIRLRQRASGIGLPESTTSTVKRGRRRRAPTGLPGREL